MTRAKGRTRIRTLGTRPSAASLNASDRRLIAHYIRMARECPKSQALYLEMATLADTRIKERTQ